MEDNGKNTSKQTGVEKIKAVSIITVFPILAGIISFSRGISTRIYLEEYYKYFDIDMKYVSLSHYKNVYGIVYDLAFLLIVLFSFYFSYVTCNECIGRWSHLKRVRDDTTVDKKVIRYFWRQLILSAIGPFIFCTIILFLFFKANSVLYDELGKPIPEGYVTDIFLSVIFTIFSYYVGLILSINRAKSGEKRSASENIYNEIFYKKSASEDFKNCQKGIIEEYLQLIGEWVNSKQYIFIRLSTVLAFAIAIFFMINHYSGQYDAVHQRVFLVTEDSKQVAIPVSEDKYALIDIKENGECLTLLMGRQNFHESNDFPLTKKTYEAVKKEQLE